MPFPTTRATRPPSSGVDIKVVILSELTAVKREHLASAFISRFFTPTDRVLGESGPVADANNER